MCSRSIAIGDDKRGSSAVEFAFIAPIIIVMLFCIISYGYIISLQNGVQQLVAESARSSVAGLSDGERDALARSYVSSSVSSYPFIDANSLSISTDIPSTSTFRVLAHYDMSGSFVYRMLSGLPLPNPIMTRAAVVQRGGFQ